MIPFTDPRQQKLELFKTPFDCELDKENRWIKLAEIIPWEELTRIYQKAMSSEMGRPGISARIAIGAMIIKHLKKLSDESTIEEIKENPYLQYFLGYEEYSMKRAFESSLFVTIRNRMGFETFTEFNAALIRRVSGLKQKSKSINKRKDKGTGSNNSTEQNRKENQSTSENKDKLEEGSGNKNRGMFLLDATVADQKIPYPNDINLLNECREKSEEIIDSIFLGSGINKKPRDHRRKARKAYLDVAKKKNRSLKTIRNGIKCQLNYLRREHSLDTSIVGQI